MRLLLVLTLAVVGWCILVRPSAVQGRAQLLWAALPWPGKDAEAALQAERDNAARLTARATAFRAALERVTVEASRRGAALEAAQRQLASRDGDMAERARIKALTDQLAAQQREAAMQADTLREQVDTLRDQIDAEQANGAASRHDRDAARERLSQVDAQLAAVTGERSSLQEELRAKTRAALDEQARSRDLADQLAKQQQDADAQVKTLQAQLSDARSRSTDTDGDSVPDNDPQSGGAAEPGQQPVAPAGGATVARFRLPDGIATRVVVHYAPASAAAKAHAISLCTTLQAQGVMVEQLVEAPSPVQANGLGYFYRNDESRAARIAALIPELRANVHQHPIADDVPRPGLIEIEIAG